jgi:hypothetical protein
MPYEPVWNFWSGNVAQRIFSPAITVNYAGNAAIEDRIVTDVASFGTQIGWLNEIVLALANKAAPDPKALKDLTAAVKEINEIKERHKQSALTVAEEALDELKAVHPKVYDELLSALNVRAKLDKAASDPPKA